MFEQTFKSQLVLLTSDGKLVEKLWGEIKSSYSKRGRHYHNVSHLDNLLAELLPLKTEIQDWQTLLFSIAYHDIIYNILKSDNEEQSAQVACNRLALLPTPASRRDKCFSQIMATKEHSIADDNDTNLFTDADLAVLGSDDKTYHQYAKMIRKEYGLYPALVYNAGRRKVLHHFLQMPCIYKTDIFRDRYEQQARINLEGELNKL